MDRVDDADFDELPELHRVAPLGDKSREALATVFGSSMRGCRVHWDCAWDCALVGAGRAHVLLGLPYRRGHLVCASVTGESSHACRA